MPQALTVIETRQAPTAPAGDALSYVELSERSEAYDAETWETCEDLYKGGFHLKKKIENEDDKTCRDRYLPRVTNEEQRRYKDRIKATAYLNYFAQIVDYFSSALFTRELAVREAPDAENPRSLGSKPDSDYYSLFAANADGKGTKFPDLLRQLLNTALKKRRALLCLDMPKGGDYASRADEEKAGAGKCFAYEIPLEQVIDWDDDDDGGFRYLVIHRKKIRKGAPGQRRRTVVEEWKVWEKIEPNEPDDSALDFQPDTEAEESGASVVWRLYRIEYPPKRPPKKEDLIPLVDEGEVSFKRIPVLQMDVSEGLWVGNKVALPQLEHFQGRSELRSAEKRSLLAIPYAKLGPQAGRFGGPVPSDVAQDPSRGDVVDQFEQKGMAVLDAEDEIGFAEPEGKAYALVQQELTNLKDEIFRVVHQMALSVTNNAMAVGRSGVSKKEDRAAEGIVLGAFGRIVRDFAVLVYDTIAKARSEDVIWNAHGLDNYETEDRAILLEEAVSLDDIPIQSPTLMTYLKTQVGQRLAANMPAETQEQMREEIKASVQREQAMKVEMATTSHDATIEGMKNAANAPGAGAPGKPAGGKPAGKPGGKPGGKGGVQKAAPPKPPRVPPAGSGSGGARA